MQTRMGTQTVKESTGKGAKGVRRGTAKRRAGRETSARLVQAAHDLLESESLNRFSMRAVADRAGVGLANLQYYFPTLKDLLQALVLDLGVRYQAAYEQRLEQAGDDPVERFRAALRYDLEDITKRSTRRFFIQFWALMGALDDFKGGYLSQTYKIDIKQLGERIAARYPDVAADEVNRRATLTAAMIEGLLVVISTARTAKDREAILNSAMALAETIASGQGGNGPGPR